VLFGLVSVNDLVSCGPW